MKAPTLILLIFLTVFAANSAFADSTGTITGKVIVAKTGLPPLDAKVTIIELNRQVPVYPYDGKYIIQDVPPGIYSLKIECDYYETVQIDFVEVKTTLITVQDTAMEYQGRIIYECWREPHLWMFSNEIQDARPIIDLDWKFQSGNPNLSLDKIINVWAP